MIRGMRPLRTLALLGLLVAPARAADLDWDYEGYPEILKAAAAAKAKGRLLLVGLSGSDG